MEKPQVVTIGISGPSCSGKTTLALLLKKLLENVITINLDEFYKPDSQIPKDETTGLANWESPEALDFDSLNKAINRARSDPLSLLAEPHKLLQNNHHGSDLLSKQDFAHLFDSLDALKDIVFIIVEGFLLFYDEKVCANLDTMFFCNASRQVLKQRRESRPGYVTLEGYWVDPPGYFDQLVWPQFLKWNQHILDETKRDPRILVISTDATSAQDMASFAVHTIEHQHTKK
ncbi:P-loop containing nucleoside triphosphate hydrolase protein [Gilbertella persicaria]|uniref:Ribosylnicotinamide kinase n=1 Tax=Rhizopus stolonifer TaxID=4846 RepID=A0A367J539_RHIST|nr:P-loop containing nucleoside triphosphate hydrolase protein [Gilbertella persicaria]KAI8077948.1 P-loop containing nucleoside triphosphate hydrolase protein [Gilbertella persicaria]RCH85016.1 ribosylnicotinamide kinase [Rhizopus stolonifer]